MRVLFIFITVCSSIRFEKLTRYESMYPGDYLGDIHFYHDENRCVLEINSKPFKTWNHYSGKCRITLGFSRLLFEFFVSSFIFGNYYTYGQYFEGLVMRNNTFIKPDFVDYNNSESCLRFVNDDHGILLRYYS